MKNLTIFTKPSRRAKETESKLLDRLSGIKLNLKQHVVIVIGGDGTMLMAIKQYNDSQTAFIGISAGTLGFLQTLEKDELDLLVDALKKNSFTTIYAPLIGVREAVSKKSIGFGFNDITIERASPRAAKFNLFVDDNAGEFIGDGVIFSTPLGSTAYSLAAGGPIIDSRAQDLMVVSPSNPHISPLYSSLQRPHVLQKDRVIKIEVNKSELTERPVQLSVDGQIMTNAIDSPIEIFMSDNTVSLLELKEKDFHSRIDKKRLGKY